MTFTFHGTRAADSSMPPSQNMTASSPSPAKRRIPTGILMIPVVWIWRRQPIIRLEQQQRDQDFFDFLTRALHPDS